MTKRKNPHRGSSFDSFLKEEGIYDEVMLTVTKRLLAHRVPEADAKAVRHKIPRWLSTLRTSRAALDRLLDADNFTSVTLNNGPRGGFRQGLVHYAEGCGIGGGEQL